MDQRERDEIRARLDRPHLRSALSPLVTAREVRAMLDALDAVTPAAGAPVAGTGERASDPAGAPCAASSRDGGGGP